MNDICLQSPAKKRSILHDLVDIQIEEDVKRCADDIYNKITTKVARSGNRKSLMIFLIYIAYKELGRPKNPKFLAKIMNTELSEVISAITKFSDNQTGYISNFPDVEMADFLPELCQNLGLKNEQIDDCIKLGNELLIKDPSLKKFKPQYTAAGLLFFYLSMKTTNINKKHFSDSVGTSASTVSSIYKKMAVAHNTA
jgi:transcription initiation factor TFIIIB Brf1 subunit/transcription initiation factor TFIIB